MEGSGGSPAIAGYEVIDLLGRGGFSSVYRANQLSVGRAVALKVLDAWDNDPEVERRFRAECRSVGALSWHPHIVAVFDAGISGDGRPFMSMELFEAGSLADRLKTQGRLATDEVIRIGLEVADALAAAHQAGVVHRDIKPANILVGRRDEFVLSDFGIAAFNDATRSSTGSFSGTLAFTAPEVLLGQRATTSSDIFSLGVTLHTLLSGASTFASGGSTSPGAIVQRVINEPPPQLPPDVPRWLVELIDQATAKSPDDRLPTVAELRDRLSLGGRSTGNGSPPAAADGPAGATLADADDATRVRPPPSAASAAEEAPAAGDVQGTAAIEASDTAANSATAGATPRRVWPLVITLAVVGAVAALAFLAVSRGLFGDGTQPSREPSTEVPKGGIVLDDYSGFTELSSSGGALWAIPNAGAGPLLRVDPFTDRVEAIDAVRPAGDAALTVSGTSDSVWVRKSAQTPDGEGSLFKLDPSSGAVVARLPLKGFMAERVAVAENAVWTSFEVENSLFTRIARVDPESGDVVAVIDRDIENLIGLAAAPSGVWVLVDQLASGGPSQLTRIDPGTNAVADTIDIPDAFTASQVVADEGGVWLLGRRRARVELLRIDVTMNEAIPDAVPVAGANESYGGLALGGGFLWLTLEDTNAEGRSTGARLEQREAATGRLVATFELGEFAGPVAWADSGVIWSVTGTDPSGTTWLVPTSP